MRQEPVDIAAFGEEGASALLALVVAINAWNAIGVTARCWSVKLRDQD